MNEIIIIGTQPSCPRCKLLTNITAFISEKIALNANVRHIAYTSQEAESIARVAGLVPGTAKDVAKKAGIDVVWSNIVEESKNAQLVSTDVDNPIIPQFSELMKEVALLDNALRPFETIAKDIGIMMTPVLVINGKIIHQGSVPNPAQIEEWLSAT